MKRIFFSAALLLVLALPQVSRGDAAADLAAGRVALEAGEIEKAHALLLAAAQALPNSVEAQFALAECFVKLGDLEKALARYRNVLKLSPEHAAARRIVAALTGEQTSFEEQLAAARGLVEAGVYTAAEPILRRLVQEPAEPARRASARLLLAESQLWHGAPPAALADALRVVQESTDAKLTGPARVLAALALLQLAEPQTTRSAEQLAAAGELAPPWAARAALARTLAQLEDAGKAAENSAALVGGLASVPPGNYRQAIIERASKALVAVAHTRLGQGDSTAAVAIVWPMVSGQGVPGLEAVLKPIEATGGWLPKQAAAGRVQAAAVLAAAGKLEFNRFGAGAKLHGYWLAAEVLRQTAADELAAAELIRLGAELAALSRPSHDRKPGAILSTADQIQREALLQAATRAPTTPLRQQIVEQISAQIDRYRQAGDEATGWAQFVALDAAAKPPKVQLAAELERLPPDSAHSNLLGLLAATAMNLGQKAFQEAAATLSPEANATVNQFDAAAIVLYARLAVHYPADASATERVGALIDRYAGAARWGAAAEAAGLFYGPQQGEAVRWAVVLLKVRQAIYAEDRLLAASRQLGKELSPAVKEILADALQVLAAYPGKASRASLANVAGSFVHRYAGLKRADLAEAVIAAASAGESGAALADWALWMRAGLLEQQAAEALFAQVGQSDSTTGPPLHELHKAELAVLSEMIAKHPQSEYLSAGVERVVHIANLYQNYRAFDVARGVIADFLKTHGKLAAAERLEYQNVQLSLDKARTLFGERKDKLRPPDKLSPEFIAALDALAAYLKAHPTGDYAAAAEGELLAVARTYGEAGGWPVSREVLARLAAAVPDFASPAHLKFLEAATHLGELDRAYGLSLLTPAHKERVETGSSSATESSIAGEALAKNLSGPASGLSVSGPSASRPADPSAKLPAIKEPGKGAGGFGGASTYGPGGVPGLPQPGFDYFKTDPGASEVTSRPSETALAMIRQSQQRQFQPIAMLDDGKHGNEGKDAPQQAAVPLPGGPVLTAAEMQRQDAAADRAYAILVELVKSSAPAEAAVAGRAREQVLWLFGFFEGQMRPDRSLAYIKKYLADRPTDPARIALALQAIHNQLAYAELRRPTDRVNQAWLDERHARFEAARAELAAFIKAWPEKQDWLQQARLLVVGSFEREAQLAAAVSTVRAGGLLVQGAEALLSMYASDPPSAGPGDFPSRLWNLADRLCTYSQEEQAIYVLSQIPLHFPIDGHANQAVLRIAQLHAANLADPLRAVERYQEYLSLAGDDENVRVNIFSLAQQLLARQRFVESLHVFGVFVDSFPTDNRAALALQAIGQTHQTNEVWEDALKVYQRVLDEYPGVPAVPQVKLAMAECHINLSQWRRARDLYEEFAAQFPQDGQVPLAQARLGVLKNLDRYETLLADNQVQRNKDDAQFQIGRIVYTELQNPVKAVAEFRKVVTKHPKSDLADDAQLEIGKGLLALNKLDEARQELLQLPLKFPNSPLADDALFLVGQSYEQHAIKLASITAESARKEAYELGQRSAYRRFNEQVAGRGGLQQQRRDELKKLGDADALALDEARNAATELNFLQEGIANTAKLAEQQAETESALEVANRQDRINDAYRQAVGMYLKAATDYPLGDKTDDSLFKVAQIFETHLKDRKSAMETYQRIVKLFPGTPLAEDAAWKVAQFHEREAQYTAAAAAYRDFIRNYPGSGRVADAQFALAEVLEQLGNWIDAMDAYETFRQKFGNHPKAQLAMEQINWIKAYRK